MENKIKKLLETPDNIELIRDAICAILKIECTAQYELAKENPDAAEYRIGVWKEHSRPWALSEDAEKKYPFPLVNVQLIGFKSDTPAGAQFGQKKYSAEFYLDCYARGEFGNGKDDDTDSAVKSWKIGRVIRNIISSEHYAYLGLRGVVLKYSVTEGNTGDPRNRESSAQSITICRLILSVDYYEDSPQVDGEPFLEYGFIASSPSGEVLLNFAGTPGANQDKEDQL